MATEGWAFENFGTLPGGGVPLKVTVGASSTAPLRDLQGFWRGILDLEGCEGLEEPSGSRLRCLGFRV